MTGRPALSRGVVAALALCAALSACAWRPAPHSDESAWMGAPLGIAITNCSCSARGLRVCWTADVPGPYNVAIHLPRELSLSRRCPVVERVTDERTAFFPGSFRSVAVFAQVMTAAAAAADTNRLALTDAEWAAHVESIRAAPPYTALNPAVSREVDRTPRLALVSDCTWAGFVASDDPNPNFAFTVDRLFGPPVTNWVQDIVYTNWQAHYRAGESAPWRVATNVGVYASGDLAQQDWVFVGTNAYASGATLVCCTEERAQHNDYPQVVFDPHGDPVRSVPYEFSMSVRDADTSVGTGYRLLYFEDTGVVLAQRAYSARTNASDEVCLERGFVSLSAHGGMRYAADWEGVLYFQADTNSAPDVIGGPSR